MPDYRSVENTVDRALQVTLRGLAQHNLIYMKNPKAGCTTVTQALWKEASGVALTAQKDIHNLAVARFEHRLSTMPWCGQAKVVAFVRHPLVRIASAYKDKILIRKDDFVRNRFCERYAVDPGTDISFERFMQLIHDDPDPQTVDEHFRPQFLNIFFPFVVPNFIGRVENLDRDLARFMEVALGRAGQKAEALNQGAGRTSDEIDRFFGRQGETLDRALDLYRDDFRYFDYPEDVRDMDPGDYEPGFHDHAHPRLARLHALTQLRLNASGPLSDDAARMLHEDILHGVLSSAETEAIYKAFGNGAAPLRDIGAALDATPEVLTRDARVRLSTLTGLLEHLTRPEAPAPPPAPEPAAADTQKEARSFFGKLRRRHAPGP